MKLITLNTWGGKIHKPFLEFIIEHKDVDIFCLQEMYHEAEGKEKDPDFLDVSFNLFTDIQALLPEHQGFFRPYVEDYCGLAIFVRKEYIVTDEGEHFVYKHKGYVFDLENPGNFARNLHYIKFEINGKPLTVFNFHGLWTGQGKGDTEDRLSQSQKIKEFMNTIGGDKILCGDFNLRPDTESVRILEGAGLRNLVKESGVISTRTSFYTKSEKFADYIFVSSDLKVVDFKVLPHEVSDHAPLFVEFE